MFGREGRTSPEAPDSMGTFGDQRDGEKISLKRGRSGEENQSEKKTKTVQGLQIRCYSPHMARGCFVGKGDTSPGGGMRQPYNADARGERGGFEPRISRGGRVRK